MNESEGEESHEVSDPVVGYYFTDALYRSFSYLGCIKSIERAQLPIDIVSGSGWGGLVAALYSKYKDSSKVEWKVFNLMQGLKDNDPIYKSEWSYKIGNFLAQEFHNEKVESLKVPLVIPFYNNKKGKVSYRSRGPFDLELSSILNLQFVSKNFLYTSAIVASPLSLQGMRKKGVDIIIVFDALSPDVSFKKIDSHVWGVYMRYFGLFQLQKKKAQEASRYFFSLGENRFHLDDSSKINETILLGEESCEKIASQIKEIIKDWKDERKNL